MGVTPPPITWLAAPQDGTADIGNENWPLLDDLLSREPSAVPELGHQARRDALSALAKAAFEP